MANETAIERTRPQEVDIKHRSSQRPQTWTYRPLVDIFDTPDEVLLHADLPGVNPEHVDVSVEAGILTIQAQVQPRGVQGARTVLNEYGVGNFHRRFEIDDTIDPDHINAEYRDGVLQVRLPKAPRAKRRRIPVSA